MFLSFFCLASLIYKMPPGTRDQVCSSFLEEAYLEVICKTFMKKGYKFGPPGPKNGHFWSFLAIFEVFGLRILFRERERIFLIWCFWAYLEVICK